MVRHFMPNSFEIQNDLCVFTHRRQVGFWALTNVAHPCSLTSTLTMKHMSCFCCLRTKVNLPLRSVGRFVATETFCTGQEHLFFSPVNDLVSCFSWTPCRKTNAMAINNCGEIVHACLFWVSLQQAWKKLERTPKTFLRLKWNVTKKVDKTANLVSQS